MGISGKLGYGLLGMYFAGPVGAIIGAVIGHALDKRDEDFLPSQGGQHVINSMDHLLTCLTILSAKLAKADGVVSPSEVEVLNQFLKGNGLNNEQRELYAGIYNEAKKETYGYQETAQDLARVIKGLGRPFNKQAFTEVLFNLLFVIASADGVISEPEIEFIRKTATIFSLPASHLQQLEQQYFNGVDSGGGSLTQAYKILNCTPKDSDSQIRQSYRQMILKFHPDKITSKDLPPEFTDFAQQKSSEIITAHETIMNSRKKK